MPPGSPGIFRRKSSTEISPHATLLAARSSAGTDDLSENKMAATATAVTPQGWPNTKDDYELKEVIG